MRNARVSYRIYPTDYINHLHRIRGLEGRRKARSFMEYWHDMEFGMINSIGFYAKSWKCSKSTASDWIKEFDEESDKFHYLWHLKNKQHYSYVKNEAERFEHFEPNDSNGSEALYHGACKESTEQFEHSEPNKVNNIYNDDNKPAAFWSDREFTHLYFIYSQNTRFAGSKEKAWEAYRAIDVDTDMMSLAIMQYLNDEQRGVKLQNMENFIKKGTYESYLPKYIRVTTDSGIIEGEYIKEQSVIVNEKREVIAELTPDRLVALFSEKRLEYINPVGRKVG